MSRSGTASHHANEILNTSGGHFTCFYYPEFRQGHAVVDRTLTLLVPCQAEIAKLERAKATRFPGSHEVWSFGWSGSIDDLTIYSHSPGSS